MINRRFHHSSMCLTAFKLNTSFNLTHGEPDMKPLSWTPIKHAFASAALVATCSTTAWSAELPAFTFTPGAVDLSGSSVTADNILVSDFANVTQTGATTFSEQGFLSVTGFQLGG